MKVLLTLTEDQHQELLKHLFPGDGLEAVAFIACGRAAGTERHRLVAKVIFLIPHDKCDRNRDSVSWQAPDDIEPLLIRAEVEKLSLIKVHSHPQGFSRFSQVDDASDTELLPTLHSWIEADIPHGSAIMLPDGKLLGRYTWNSEVMKAFDGIGIIGSSLDFSWKEEVDEVNPEFGTSHDQAFGEGTTRRLQKLRIAVVGASGTGGPVIEQLARLGVGHLVLIDDDKIEERNLNRIPFATAEDAKAGIEKVISAANDLARKGLETKVTYVVGTVQTPKAIRAISECDVLFGCVDTAHGRFIMNLAASHYLLPYFDIGILFDAEQKGEKRGAIKDILGTIHYLVPGRSSLLTRDKFTMEDVRAEGLHKDDPAAAKQQVEDKYIKGMQVHRPAVISVNTLAAAVAVNDFLARLHPYRKLKNSEIASIEFSLGELRFTTDEEMETCATMKSCVGHGDRKPLLGLP